jgi:hypothetical protein
MVDVASPKNLFVAFLVASIATILVSPKAAAQPEQWPNLGSGASAWSGIGGGEFIAIPGGPAPVSQDSRYARVANAQSLITGEQANYRISDVTNPNLMQWAREVMQQDNEEVLAGKIAFSPRSTCSPGGIPGFILMGGGGMHVLQTADQVVMIHEGDGQMRRIHLNVPHSENSEPSWYGDSVGHYEGDTLVVDTIGLNDRSFVDAYRTPHTENLHVVERWRLVDDGEVLEVHVTVDDPGTFVQPWQALRRFRREVRPLEEMRCAENNEQFYSGFMPIADSFDF